MIRNDCFCKDLWSGFAAYDMPIKIGRGEISRLRRRYAQQNGLAADASR